MNFKLVIILLTCLYLAFNVIISKVKSPKEMKEKFITGQCVVGIIAANAFYAPAWILKGLRIAINFLVK